MTRDTMYADNRYVYRISPTDARTIERKANRPYHAGTSTCVATRRTRRRLPSSIWARAT